MLEFEEYKQKLNGLKPDLENLQTALKLDDARAEIAQLEAEAAQEGFWNDLQRSSKVLQRTKQLKSKCEQFDKLQSAWEDLYTLCEMALEENDDSMLEELARDYGAFEKKLEETRLSTLLSGEYDSAGAILSFHAGAGGTEAQDWAQMLYRMYTRWAERHGFKYEDHRLSGRGRGRAQKRRHRCSSPGRTPTATSKARAASTAWCASPPSTPPAAGRPAFAALEVMPHIADDNGG